MNNKKVVKNAKWMIVCKVGQSLLQLLIGMLSARYLGPANYGLINYAKSVVAFVGPFTQLGLNATLVRELIEEPDKEGEIMGTSMALGFFSSLICVGVVWSFASVANAGETQTIIVCVLYSISLIFQAIELIQYWFHSKLQSKYPSIMMLIAYIAVSVYKILLLASKKNIYWFAIAHAIECGIIGLFLLGLYFKQGNQRLTFSKVMAKQLLSNSYPYIFSSLMVTLFQNTDHIMLKMISGNAENGFYSAAITCATVCSFVYAAIIDSMRPVILTSKKTGSDDYGKQISTLYCLITYLALAQSVVFVFLAKPIVWILYGADYMKTVPVLQILVWYVAFSQMGRIRNIWILAEGKQKVLWKINLIGALLNMCINAILIPYWGAFGAAFTSFVTQMFTNLGLGYIMKPLRENNRLLMTGVHPKYLFDMIQNFLHLNTRSLHD